MISLLKSVFGRKSIAMPVAAPVNATTIQQNIRPIYFIDHDEQGLYLLATHVTSSAYEEAIRHEGLRPIQDLRTAVSGYLHEIAPSHDREIARILKFTQQSDRSDGLALLVSGRLNSEPEPRCTYANLLFGGRDYLNSASNNAARDGGEIFKAARRLVAKRLRLDLQPRFATAHPIVALIKLRLNAVGNELSVPNAPDYGPISYRPLDIPSFGGAGEIRIIGDIPSSEIKVIPGEDFLKREVILISPAAEKLLQQLQLSGG